MIDLHLFPESEPGFSGSSDAGVSAPSSESSSASLPSFEPDRGDPASNQPQFQSPSGTAAPGGGGPPGGPPRTTPPGDPNVSAIQSQAQPASDWQSIRDAAARFGYQGLSSFQDDEAALVHLVQQAQRAQQADAYAQLGRAIAPELQQYQEFRKTQSAPGAAAAPPAYAPPPFDQKWMSLVDRDPASGMYYAKPGVNPAVAEAVNKRMDWQEKFTQDPLSVMDQYAQAKLPEIVQREVKQALASYQRDNAVNSILAANDAWLYQRNASGQYAQGPNGRVPTPEGAAYIQQVRQLQESGVTDPTTQDTLARQLVAGQLALARLQSANGQPAQLHQQAAQYRPNVNPAQARSPLERQQTPGSVEPNGEGLSLRDMMAQAFEQAGYTDQRFQQELGF